MKLFKPEDFFKLENDADVPKSNEVLWYSMKKTFAERAAADANLRFEAWLAKQPEVFAENGPALFTETKGAVVGYWGGLKRDTDTHRARLVCIEKIEGEK